MTLLDVTVGVVGVVAAVLAVALPVVVGPTRLRALLERPRERLRPAVVPLAMVGVVLAINGVARDVGPAVSWLLGWNVTGTIYALEGAVVADLQGALPAALTPYLSFAYVYGYAFLLVFPVVAYLALADARPLRVTCVAYALNYLVGLACYLLFIAYGPRNMLPEQVAPLLYTAWPSSFLLTSEVNANTNVFPSLHTSLSVTVALLAYRTRDRYPRWLPLAAALAASVVLATMYLGIHWLTDVVAGVALAVGSVLVAGRLVDGPAGRWLAWPGVDAGALPDAVADGGEERPADTGDRPSGADAAPPGDDG